jgi:hypothetical protein
MGEFLFLTGKGNTPYIQDLLEYKNDDKEGHITFNGYYYIEDSDLPRTLLMLPHHTNPVYEIEIYKRALIKNTSVVGPVEDTDGSTMNVCFFPTMYQTLYFRVLHKSEQFHEVPDTIKAKYIRANE